MKMKIALIAVACFVLLTSCSQQPTETPAPPATPAPTQISTPTPSPTFTDNEVVDEVAFNTTPEEVIEVLAANIEDSASVSPLDITPETAAWDPSGTTVAGTYYSYAIHDGFSLNIVDSTQSGKVQSVSVIASASSLTEESARDLGRYQATIVAMFEPDSNRWDTIDADLNIAQANFSEDNIYFATGSIASYTYVITDGVSMLTIDPL